LVESRGWLKLAAMPPGAKSLASGRIVTELPNMQQPDMQIILDRILAGDELRDVPVDFRTLRDVHLSIAIDSGPMPDGQFWVAARDLAEGAPVAGRLLQAQRMEFMGVAVTGVIHDLNNILTGLGGTLELLQEGGNPSTPLLNSLSALLRRSRDLTRQLLEAARPATPGPKPLDLRTPVRQAADLMRHSLGEGMRVVLELPRRQIPVNADRTELVRTLFNLAINARDALAGEGGEIHLEVGVRRDPGRCRSFRWPGPDHARIRVWDTGPGIAPDMVGRVFEPFFSTKAPDRGTGMGLSVVHHVVVAHDGRIEYIDLPDRGACFEIDLPVFRGAVDDDEPTRVISLPTIDAPAKALTGLRLLIADDEPALRMMLADALSLRGAEVTTAEDGRTAVAALERATREGARFDVAVIDFHMPGLGGVHVLQRARKLDRDLGLVLCSGMEPSIELWEELAGLEARFLPKPFRLAEAVDAILGR
jgi:two-component system, cell cycle sensor histidine kinase and response regulator CckA